MSAYRIELRDAGGAVAVVRNVVFEDDDAAIDHIGAIDHPHAMALWQGDRLVADFPPWPNYLAATARAKTFKLVSQRR